MVQAKVCRTNLIMIPRYSEQKPRSKKKKFETVFTHMPNLYIKIHINIKYMIKATKIYHRYVLCNQNFF